MDSNDTLADIRRQCNRLASTMSDDDRFGASEALRMLVVQLDRSLSQGGPLPDDWHEFHSACPSETD